MTDEKKIDDAEKSKETPFKRSFSLLKKPLIPHYDCLPEATPLKEQKSGQKLLNGDTPMPGFEEFRKYKRVNESRIITPYKPESSKKETVKLDAKIFPVLEIKNADRFILEKIKNIPVQSLERLLQTIHTYPDTGFLTMNRPHMDILDDYQPYTYEICHYNEKDTMNYVTASTNGLVEFYKGDADFMELDRLLVEYELFQSLKNIPLFSYLYVWKAFMVWFEKIRRRKFENAKVKIEAFFGEKYKSSANK